jgi:hypothetical protein
MGPPDDAVNIAKTGIKSWLAIESRRHIGSKEVVAGCDHEAVPTIFTVLSPRLLIPSRKLQVFVLVTPTPPQRKESTRVTMTYTTEGTVWPEDPIPEKIKALIDRFYIIADLKAPEAGPRLAEEIFAPNATLVMGAHKTAGSEGRTAACSFEF